jgi:uncharacterized membrane protein
MRRYRIMHAVQSSLWLVPMLCMATGSLLVLGTLWLDRRSGYHLVPQSVTGTPADAQAILSVFATAVATLTTLVLTVTLVAVQLAMGQFSPRIVGSLLADRFSQLAIGLFGATFLVSVLTLREITGFETGNVPGLSMLLAYLLMFASVVLLILFVHHAGQGLRVAGLIDLVGDQTRRLIQSSYPQDSPPPADPYVIPAPEPGNVFAVDRTGLVEAARRAGCLLELVPVVGDFVAGGAPLLRVHPGPVDSRGDGTTGPDLGRLRPDAIARLIVVADERVHTEDTAYGIRKLVDIAERSTAQTFEDPTTALQALHRLHDLLRSLATRRFPSGLYPDESGVVRLVERTLTWAGFIRLAFDEIRLAGAGNPQISRRLCAALQDLKSVAPPDRQVPLDRQLRLLTAAVHRCYEDEEDVTAALTPDTEGIGSGADVTTAVHVETAAGPRATVHPDGRPAA